MKSSAPHKLQQEESHKPDYRGGGGVWREGELVCEWEKRKRERGERERTTQKNVEFTMNIIREKIRFSRWH